MSIDEFCSITSGSPEVAREYLQVCENDLQAAIALYFENGQTPLTQRPEEFSEVTEQPTDSQGIGTDMTAQDEELARSLDRKEREKSKEDIRAPILGSKTVLSQGIGPHNFLDGTNAVPGNGLNSAAHMRRAGFGIFNQDLNAWTDDVPCSSSDRLARATAGQSEQSIMHNRLAMMYRPPFDIMFQQSLSEARTVAVKENRWIIVNLQDLTDFHCQTINRDIWRDQSVKDAVRHNFLMLQFTNDSVQGIDYLRLYPVSQYPHIAIIDPRTGERMHVWNSSMRASQFLQDLFEFLDRYNLDPKFKNPIAKKARLVAKDNEVFDIEAEGKNSQAAIIDISGDSSEEQDSVDSEEQAGSQTSQKSSTVSARDHRDPISKDNGPSTRIMIKFPDAEHQTCIAHFKLDEPVRSVYEQVRFLFPDRSDFSLMFFNNTLDDRLDSTIQEADLKNAAVMVHWESDTD